MSSRIALVSGAVALSFAAHVACSTDSAGDAIASAGADAGSTQADAARDGSDADAGGSEAAGDYDFQLPPPGTKMERLDAMGVALLSTVLMNRDRDPLAAGSLNPFNTNSTPGGVDNDNRYQKDTPDTHHTLQTPVIFLHFLRVLHGYWRDQLKSLGYEVCSVAALPPLHLVASPCTLQTIRMKDGTDGPRVIDAVIPDYVSLDLDAPLGFPNGRTPSEPISDKILAMGFLKMGGNCKGSPCTIETFSDVPLQVPKNDRDFKPTFPYLAEPWFYAKPGGPNYFWPAGTRLADPE